MKTLASKLYQRVTHFTLAFVVAVSSLAAIGPFVFSSAANAANSTVCASGCDFTNIQDAINAPSTVAGDVITVGAGVYPEIVINKPVSIIGAGTDATSIVASNANVTPVVFATNGAMLSHVTITHDYTADELAAWNFNNNGVTFNQNSQNNVLTNTVVSKNRNGVYINNAQNNVVMNNVIVDNRTGINLTNNVNGTQIIGNVIQDNWTLGIVYYSQGFATDFNTVIVSGNSFLNNWYSEIVVKDTGASTGTFNVEHNTYSDNPVTYSTSTSASLNEPGFAAQRPVSLGGSATAPAGEYPTFRLYNNIGVTLQYDSVSPTFTITNPVDGAAVKDTQTIQAQITDLSGITKVLMTIPTKTGNKTFTWEQGKANNSLTRTGDIFSVTVDTNTMNDGIAHVVLRGTDGAGNTRYWNNNANNRQHGFLVDNTNPSVSITAPPAGTNLESAFTITGNANDTGSGIDRVEIVINKWVNGAFAGRVVEFEPATLNGNSFSYDVPALETLENGYYALRAIAYDKAGNSKTTGHDITAHDTTDPEITIDNLTVSTDKQLSFDLEATDFGSGLEIVAANIYNEDDTGDPLIRLGKNSSGGSTGTTRLNDPYSGLPAGTDSFSTTISGVDVSGLASGTYTIRAFARDHVGNELRFLLVRFTVDNTAPVVTINDVAPVTAGDIVTFSGTFSEPSTLTFLFGGTDLSSELDVAGNSWSIDVDTTGLAEDLYEARITAVDTAGNSDFSSTAATVLVVQEPLPLPDTGTVGDDEDEEEPTTASTTTTTPLITSPAAILGDTTETDPATETDDTDVAGASTDQNVAAVDTDPTDGTIFGLAWYWWLLILAALAAAASWIVAALRRRSAES